jgi:DNA-nicking Smr family endonuclease
MSRPGRPPRSQQRLLTEEDRALWSSVAQSLKPVRTKGRVNKTAEAEAGTDFPSLSPPASQPAAVQADKAGSLPVLPSPSSKQARPTPPLADFDRRQAKRIAAGRIEIEARIDLHGMRANEAHGTLRAFILRCYAQGKRSLLVITGKGATADIRDQPFELHHRHERGILKRHVPLWLAEPEMRAVVVSFTTAHARHGGEGALYIRLRSRQRTGRTSD